MVHYRSYRLASEPINNIGFTLFPSAIPLSYALSLSVNNFARRRRLISM